MICELRCVPELASVAFRPILREKSVRPEFPADFYHVWRKTAKDLGYDNSGRGL